MSSRVTLPVAVHLFLMDENKILLLRRFNTGYEDGNYSVIAGHIDGNETVYSAMIREAYEEAGIVITTDNLRPVQVMHRKKTNGEYIDYFFVCVKWENPIENKEPDKCDDLTWVEMDSLPVNMVAYVRQALENYKSGLSFAVFGWD
jgi:8-oxo-dGTP pyrophosphatase MutT (NUDIX family)